MDDEQILLEDEEIYVIIPKEAMAKGHMIIAPKEKYVILEEVPEDLLHKIFQVGNRLSGILFEILDCEGTNFLIQNGEPAGQTVDVFSLNILPRWEDDNVDLEWDGDEVDQQALDSVLQRFEETEKKKKEEEYLQEQKKKVEETEESESMEDNTLVKHLDRTP